MTGLWGGANGDLGQVKPQVRRDEGVTSDGQQLTTPALVAGVPAGFHDTCGTNDTFVKLSNSALVISFIQ